MTMKKLKLFHSDNNPLFFYDCEGRSPSNSIYKDLNIFALIEKNKWELVDNIEDADVIPVYMSVFSDDPKDADYYKWFQNYLRPDQVVIFMHLYNCDSWLTPHFFRSQSVNTIRNCHNKVLIIHTNNHDDGIDPNYIFHDIMFNRQKYYMFDNVDEIKVFQGGFVWTEHAIKEFYTVGEIDKKFDSNNKKFLCLNRIYTFGEHLQKQRSVRQCLRSELEKLDDIYLSNPLEGIFFYPNGYKLGDPRLSKFEVDRTSGRWYPAADYYYNTSYISVYIESSITATDESGTYCASEKTFDPMIKGNFILPFSNANFVANLKKFYGFRFPEWIDYSYERIEDIDLRFDAYINEVKRIHRLPIEKLHEFYIQDKTILDYNRQIFLNKDYDSLHDKVLNSIIQLGWYARGSWT